MVPLDLIRFDCQHLMDPIRFHWIWWDLIAKISWIPQVHCVWWELIAKITWIPQGSDGFDEIWLLKSPGSHKVRMDLMRFDCQNLMDPTRCHWIWWDLIAKKSWIPRDSIGFCEACLLQISWIPIRSWIWWDLIAKISWIPRDSIGFDEIWLQKSHGSHESIPCPLDKVWTWLFWQY